MIGLVERMLDLNRRLPAAGTDHEKRLVEMQVEQTDREIDALPRPLRPFARRDRGRRGERRPAEGMGGAGVTPSGRSSARSGPGPRGA
jgi:hypothetical protein